MDRWFRVAVVMLPALLTAVLAIAVNVPKSLRESAAARLHNQRLELAREIVVHAGFYGTIASALLGVPATSWFGSVTIAVWALMAFWVASMISNKLHEREREEQLLRSRESHRRLAGAIRSIVRDEIVRALHSASTANAGGAGDGAAAPPPSGLENDPQRTDNQPSCVKE